MEYPKYRWFILGLTALTGALAIGAPAVCLAPLFKEIAADLHLDLVQMGLIWSIGSLPAIFTSPIVGSLADRFGPKRIILPGTILLGLTAGARGLATDFLSLLCIIIAIGVLLPMVTVCSYKIVGIWFPRKELGIANGIVAMGMGFGFLLGAMLSATVLSPLLGGWRAVIFFYGILAVILGVPWFFARANPGTELRAQAEFRAIPMREGLAHILKVGNVWLLGIAVLGVGGCVQGLSGYLPLYLRGLGWENVSADGALSLMSAVSLVFILPIALWSDRLRTRKTLLLGMLLMIAIGVGLLSVANGWLVWVAVILVGMAQNGSSALLMTMVIETDGVGPVYAGSASGFTTTFMMVGNLLSPPLGNSLAAFNPGLPFIFWAALALMAVASLAFSAGAKAREVQLT